ncbi:DNA polymerase III subunit epsilon [Acidisoma sp. 7E03]
MTRSILFDTETTGLDPKTGDRVIEIAALELINDLPTGVHFHRLVHPQRDIPEEATRVHGFTLEHLKDAPVFGLVAAEMLAFMGESELLVAHNAPFDFNFLNWELKLLGLPLLAPHRMVDTLAMAKERFPGMPNSLDALCRRFGIDLSARTSHNALLDCKLLAEVYIELTGGRQRGLSLAAVEGGASTTHAQYDAPATRAPRPILVSQGEAARHAAFLAQLKDPIWLREPPAEAAAAAG